MSKPARVLRFDAAAAQSAQDEALARVAAAAKEQATKALKWAVYNTAKSMPSFTSDDVWRAAGEIPEIVEPRLLGAIMQAAAKASVCVGTDQYVKSCMVSNHRRPVRVWDSLIYQP